MDELLRANPSTLAFMALALVLGFGSLLIKSGEVAIKREVLALDEQAVDIFQEQNYANMIAMNLKRLENIEVKYYELETRHNMLNERYATTSRSLDETVTALEESERQRVELTERVKHLEEENTKLREKIEALEKVQGI